MRPATLVLAAAAAATAALLAAAGRVPPHDVLEPLAEPKLRASLATLQAWLASPPADDDAAVASSHRDMRSSGPSVVGRYYVLPEVQGAFLKAWSELLRATPGDEAAAGTQRGGHGGGVLVNELFKHGDSNVHWLSYSQFGSRRAAKAYYDSQAVSEFVDALAALDVDAAAEPLEQPPGSSELHAGREKHVCVFVSYRVPPSAAGAFVDAWQKAEGCVEREKHTRDYALRRAALDNSAFYAYAEHACWQDFHDHWESDHARKLRGELDGLGVVWRLSPLELVPHEQVAGGSD